MENLEKLTELQKSIGYLPGEVHPVAMLGLMGEVGEVAEAATFVTPKAKSLTQEGFFEFQSNCWRFVNTAAEIDSFKKQLRGSKEIHFAVKPDEVEFDIELADVFYYLNAIAIGRGLTLDDLARISYEKVMRKRAAIGPEMPGK